MNLTQYKTIEHYELKDVVARKIKIQTDLAASKLKYIYINQEKRCAYVSTSPKDLLDSNYVKKPLIISNLGVSFLLQSSVIPFPYTIYKNLYCIGIGDTFELYVEGNQIKYKHCHKFPFFNKNRGINGYTEAKYEEIILLLSKSVSEFNNINNKKYLFLSAGKDSMSLALAIATAGYQKEVECITYKAPREQDESSIVQAITNKLGLKHRIIELPKKIEKNHVQSIELFFYESPFPCLDNAILAYPIYAGLLDLESSTVIDGMGNDVYIGHIPTSKEYNRQKYLSSLSKFKKFSSNLSYSNFLLELFKYRVELVGISGLQFNVAKRLFNKSIDVNEYWCNEEKKKQDWDYLDLRADTRGCVLDQLVMMNKIRFSSMVYNFDVEFPWTNDDVAKYFYNMPETVLFDRKHLKNKIILRMLLIEKLNLNSDLIGKKGYRFDYYLLLDQMRQNVLNEIKSCKLWTMEINDFVKRINYMSQVSNREGKIAKGLLYKLFLISAWYNNCKYLR
ncbi:hypothetical protein [Heliorestis convoluta]|uniref:asparagine synthase (glutamine-hydrolyzing) n=1 Tax=Heliorestis convoluta TaxID=356322 RepID=A0A5Q2N094_9FIRM|nr:hypothetical protein [Heliorestis convoluta]QGG47199.1 hypothetical protein FTV88_1047 [Heliorestis convoluta]